MQQARALQQSEAFGEYRQRRVVVEHRLARLVQLGIRQSRYFGRAKTKVQLYLAATVANLTLVAAKAGLPAGPGCGSSVGSQGVRRTLRSSPGLLQGVTDPALGEHLHLIVPGGRQTSRCRWQGIVSCHGGDPGPQWWSL